MDNLEELYKKKFDAFEQNPKDSFWSQLEPNIPPKPTKSNKRLAFFLFFMAGILFSCLGAYVYKYCTGRELEQLDALYIPIDNSINELVAVQNEKNIIAKYSNVTKNTPLKKKKVDTSLTSTKNQLPIKVDTNYSVVNRLNEKQKNPKKTEVASTKSYLKPNLDKLEKTQKNALWSIVVLPTLSLSELEIKEPIIPYKKPRIKPLKKLKASSIQPFVDVLLTPYSRGKLNITTVNNSFAPAITTYKTLGYQIQVGGIVRNKWQIQLGFSQHQFNIEATNIALIRANPIGTTLVEQGYSKTFSYAVNGPIETVQGRATIVGTKEQFQGQLVSIRHLIQSLHNQVGYRFSLGTRWQLTPLVGAHLSWAKKGKLSLASSQLLISSLTLSQNTLAPSSIHRTNIVEGLLGVELVYKHSRRIQLLLGNQSRFGFKPIYTNFQQNVKHRFHQVQVGLRFQL